MAEGCIVAIDALSSWPYPKQEDGTVRNTTWTDTTRSPAGKLQVGDRVSATLDGNFSDLSGPGYVMEIEYTHGDGWSEATYVHVRLDSGPTVHVPISGVSRMAPAGEQRDGSDWPSREQMAVIETAAAKFGSVAVSRLDGDNMRMGTPDGDVIVNADGERTEVAADDPRRQMIAGLRQLADWLEANPDVPTFSYSPPYVTMFAEWMDEPPTPREVARMLGKASKEAAGSYFEFRRDFSGGVHYEFNFPRDVVCERVVVGEETVEIADPNAPKITKTVEKVEWRCPPSILALDGEDA